MIGSQFKSWRESRGLTQQQTADRFKVTRTTIQNWEASPNPLPQMAEMAVEIWDARLKQENPSLGPVTLIYSDGPMFINPYGPRRRPALMQQEAYPTNAMAIARVQELWGRDDFHNPFIIEEGGSPIWNIVELGRVADGSDTGAPTLINLLRITARSIRANSCVFVRSGPRTLPPAEAAVRQQAIEAQADELDEIANAGLQVAINGRSKIDEVFRNLQALGTRAPDALVSAVNQALVIFEKSRHQLPEPRIDGVNYVMDYRGFEISYPRIPQTTGPIPISIGTNNMQLFTRLGRNDSLIMTPKREDGILEAMRRIDDAVR